MPCIAWSGKNTICLSLLAARWFQVAVGWTAGRRSALAGENTQTLVDVFLSKGSQHTHFVLDIRISYHSKPSANVSESLLHRLHACPRIPAAQQVALFSLAQNRIHCASPLGQQLRIRKSLRFTRWSTDLQTGCDSDLTALCTRAKLLALAAGARLTCGNLSHLINPFCVVFTR